jgi:N-acyl homoserine lactone hydrolase
MADYSIHVMEYAHVPLFPKSGVVYGAHNQGTLNLPFCYVLIRGKGRVAMVDVGHDNTDYGKVLGERFGVKNWHSAEVVLGEAGLKPEDVTDIFITHAHFDHMGGIALFPKATFYLQERELSAWVTIMAMPPKFRWLMAATDPGDVMRAVDLARQGRLVCVNGARQDVLPGIDLHPAYETHTAACQYVVVRNDGKRDTADGWALAGDLVYQFDNLHGNDAADPYYVPVGLATGSQTNLIMATDEMLGRVGGEAKRVIPIHEERIRTVFPTRVTKDNLHITEIALGDGAKSLVA